MDQNGGGTFVTEIPSYLKQLARLIAQAFYQIDDALIIDMLVRNACMKEKDIEELLKFDLKSLRARLATLKIEKFVQVRLRMETGLDGKAQKVNYFFINYKSLVNVIKYKLDHMRKRMETQERDATNRASFKCTNCIKTFTDLEAGELFDSMIGQFKCTFCKQPVEEDETAGPKKDSRLMLARFNEQMEVFYELLRKAEDIRLAPELLEPEPPRNPNESNDGNQHSRDRNGMWSGEATRMRGLNENTRIDFKIGGTGSDPVEEVKERPVWMFESTVGPSQREFDSSSGVSLRGTAAETSEKPSSSRDDIMSVLLAHEKKIGAIKNAFANANEDSDSEEEEMEVVNPTGMKDPSSPMDMDDDDEIIQDDNKTNQVPMISVGGERIPVTEVDDDIVARMTVAEKDAYVQQYQDFYAGVFD